VNSVVLLGLLAWLGVGSYWTWACDCDSCVRQPAMRHLARLAASDRDSL
jgi:hypothetical protein